MISVPHDRPTTPPPHTAFPTLRSPSPPPPSRTLYPESTDLALPQSADFPSDLYDDLYFDDQALSSVEKIYLLSRSTAAVHRVFISRSLHTFLSDVSPLEAVEYVLPLLNGLATDDESVKEALASNLVPVMWWFFENCHLVQDEPPEDPHDPPLLPVQTFTPILGSLLIDPNNMVCGPARYAVVESLNRLRAAPSAHENRPHFGPTERNMLEQEIIHQVIIGMGRLDIPPDPPSPSNTPLTPQHTTTDSTPADSSPAIFPSSLPSTSPSQSDTTLPPPLMTPVPVLSPGDVSMSPVSLPLQSPLLQEQESHVSLASASPRSSEEAFPDWDPSSPNPSSDSALDDLAVHQGNGADTSETQQTFDSQDDANEQAAVGRCSSMSLIATVTANATLPEETTRAFTSEVARIGKDPLYWVRREASFALGALAKVVPTELVQLSLLPLFDKLTRDPVWHVRHSAIFALPGILARLTPQHRRSLALDTVHSLTRDVAPTVRSGLLEVLGEVIYTFHEDDGGAPAELVTLFVGTGAERERPKPKRTLESVFESEEEDDSPPALPSPPLAPPGFFDDPARALVTSFNFPAVALSLGPPRWPELRTYYLFLARSPTLRVRRTIAAGIGEMARILGGAIAVRDLLDVWDALVHDAEDGETRLRALRGLGMFVAALEGDARRRVVGALVELWERWLGGWRERQCVAGTMGVLAGLVHGQEEVVRVLLGRALVDGVAAVREAGISQVVAVLRAFADRPHVADAVRGDLWSLACAEPCRRRATFVACYHALVVSDDGMAEIARDEFWEHTLPLIRDTIVDVRIGVARLLGAICDTLYADPATRPARVSEAVRRLAQDPARDVRAFVAYLLVPAPVLPRPETPPGTYARFSRPPPKTPPLGAMTERLKDLGLGPLYPAPDLVSANGEGAVTHYEALST